ncbi:MAG TPA: hypothetical protein PLD10_25395 [Rhodopila sp.]|nr:hypothetical protein [Rhodopila sp.]
MPAVIRRLPNAATTAGAAVVSDSQPFASAEEAWMWTMAALIARREGARYTANNGLVRRPCDPDDVVRCLDGLYRQRRIDLAHARILRIWGERQIAPSVNIAVERQDRRLWVEALQRLEWPLRVKGIVA